MTKEIVNVKLMYEQTGDEPKISMALIKRVKAVAMHQMQRYKSDKVTERKNDEILENW